MIESLTSEQQDWVLENYSKYSWRRLVEEFEKKWNGSFEGIKHELEDGTVRTGYAQADGMWLCDQAGTDVDEDCV